MSPLFLVYYELTVWAQFAQPYLKAWKRWDRPPQDICFLFLSVLFEWCTCNSSSSTIMDIHRNKTQTWKVSNQQHIFQKMADPILSKSQRLPSNCWCSDPSLIWCCFLQPSRIFSRLFLSFATCKKGLNRINANKMSQRWSKKASWWHAKLPSQIANGLHEIEKMECCLVLTAGEIALSFDVICGRRNCKKKHFNLQITSFILFFMHRLLYLNVWVDLHWTELKVCPLEWA